MKRKNLTRSAYTVAVGMLVTALAWSSSVQAETLSQSVSVTAAVGAQLVFDVTLKKDNTTVASTMNFGTLQPGDPSDPNSALSSPNFYQVFYSVNTAGAPYSITETAASLTKTGSSTKIPDGAFIVTPLNGVGGDPNTPLPSGTTVSPRRSAVGTGVPMFANSEGRATTFAAAYGLTSDPNSGSTAIIPPDQSAGTYTTTVTWTLTTT